MGHYQEITRRFEIDAGHRLMNHESKCVNLHGHRYAFEVTVRLKGGMHLDRVGRVIDFGVLKDKVGGWLNEFWDHGFIAEVADRAAIDFCRAHNMKLWVVDAPPSIETLTRILFDRTNLLLASDSIECVRVRGYETPVCFADFTIADKSDWEVACRPTEGQEA